MTHARQRFISEPRFTAGFWLAVGLGLLCLLTAGGSMTTTDAVVAYDVTRNMVERGSIATSGDLLGNPAYRGHDGQYYSPFGIAQSVWNIPFHLVGRAVEALSGTGGGRDRFPKAVVTLGTGAAVALLGWVCFALLMELETDPRRATATVVILVVGTPLWPYSRFGFNQPLAALFLWSAILGAVSGVRGRRFALIASGICAGLAVLARHEMIVAAVILGAYVALWGVPARPRTVSAYAIGLLPLLAVWAALNWWRFGNPLDSGYLRDPVPGFGSSILAGGIGLLFSPYSSLLLYCPMVVLSVVGLRAMARRHTPETVLFVTMFASFFLLYASLGNWMGGRSYGPRYLVPLLPSLVLPLAFWYPSPAMRMPAAAVIALSILVQLPGILVDYSKVRMERVAAGATVAQDMRWSGMPLLLNARAAIAAGPPTIAHLTNAEPVPRLTFDELSRSVGYDFWWLHLFYLGMIGRAAALTIAMALGAGTALAIWRSLVLARSLAGLRNS